MNILLWTLQILLAFHTAIGAAWKFSNTVQTTAPSLATMITPEIWAGLSVFEIICALCLVIPLFKKSLSFLIPLAAIGLALEMFAFSGLHLSSGDENMAPMMYWLVVAFISMFIAYGRIKLKPL